MTAIGRKGTPSRGGPRVGSAALAARGGIERPRRSGGVDGRRGAASRSAAFVRRSRRVAALPTRLRRKYSWARRTWPWRTTSIFSIRGLLILNVRSTPTPEAIRRTVIDRVMPPPRRRMTVPSNTWMRSRLPSTTLADTFTVSPVASSGRSVRSWSWTISSSTFTRRFLGRWAAEAAGWVFGVGREARRPVREYSTGSRSRRSAVCRRAAGPVAGRGCEPGPARERQRATAPWSPDVRIAGTSMPRNDGGRVYCGYSSRPALNDSSAVDRSSMAPGSSRITASMTTSAGSSPPVSDVVADRQLEVDERADPLVDALVARADEDEVLAQRPGQRRGRGGRPRPPGRAG